MFLEFNACGLSTRRYRVGSGRSRPMSARWWPCSRMRRSPTPGFVSATVDPPGEAAAFRAGIGARWPLLFDERHACLPRLGRVEPTDTTHGPYAPIMVVLRPDMPVHSAYDSCWARPGTFLLFDDVAVSGSSVSRQASSGRACNATSRVTHGWYRPANDHQ